MFTVAMFHPFFLLVASGFQEMVNTARTISEDILKKHIPLL